MELEDIMLSEISQRMTSVVWYHLYVESKKYNKLVNITKEVDSQINRTLWWLPVGRENGEGQHAGRGLRGTDY